jgi:hypothetical protein
MGCCGGYKRVAHPPQRVTLRTLVGKDRKTCKFCHGTLVQRVVWEKGEKTVRYKCSVCGRPGN